MFRCLAAILFALTLTTQANAEWQGSSMAVCAGHEALVGHETTLQTRAMVITTPMNNDEATWFLSSGLKFPFVGNPAWLATKFGLILNWDENDCPFMEIELGLTSTEWAVSFDTYHIRLPGGAPDYLGLYQAGRNFGKWRFGGQVKQRMIDFSYGPSASFGEGDWRATVRYFADGEGGNNALFVLSYR